MRRVIAGINMTLDGICDHTAVSADEELHQHYTGLLSSAGIILYGRITYQLMEYWKSVVENPTGVKATDEFAMMIDSIPKLVFSNTLDHTGWETAKLASRQLEEEISALRQMPGKDILIGSRSLLIQLIALDLIDEFQLCIHPVLAGKGLPLFDKINDRKIFNLSGTKTLGSGAIVLYYQPIRQ
jgi:dihydrofolate reductase